MKFSAESGNFMGWKAGTKVLTLSGFVDDLFQRSLLSACRTKGQSAEKINQFLMNQHRFGINHNSSLLFLTLSRLNSQNHSPQADIATGKKNSVKYLSLEIQSSYQHESFKKSIPELLHSLTIVRSCSGSLLQVPRLVCINTLIHRAHRIIFAAIPTFPRRVW